MKAKKIVSLILAFAMVLSTMGTAVFATEGLSQFNSADISALLSNVVFIAFAPVVQTHIQCCAITFL